MEFHHSRPGEDERKRGKAESVQSASTDCAQTEGCCATLSRPRGRSGEARVKKNLSVEASLPGRESCDGDMRVHQKASMNNCAVGAAQVGVFQQTVQPVKRCPGRLPALPAVRLRLAFQAYLMSRVKLRVIRVQCPSVTCDSPSRHRR